LAEKAFFVINPHAGRAGIKPHALDVIEVFVGAGYEVSCHTTRWPGDPTDVIRERGSAFDIVICCGGDGTVNEGLNGLMALKKRPRLAVIPAGVSNDYAYSLAIPSNAVKAAQVAVRGYPFKIDVGRFNGRFFTYVAAFGLFTDVTYQTDQNLKNALGGVAYFLEGVKRVSAIKSCHACIAHDSGVIEGDFVVGLFSNSISVAGVRTLYQDALLDDGMLEIALIKKPARAEDIRDIIDVLLNIETASSIESDFLTVIRTKKAVVTSEEGIAWTLDGEDGGVFTNAVIENRRRAVTVVAGRDMRANSIESVGEEKQRERRRHKLLRW
jgi:YegS/Rv2252/BmrU family lipid kinase